MCVCVCVWLENRRDASEMFGFLNCFYGFMIGTKKLIHVRVDNFAATFDIDFVLFVIRLITVGTKAPSLNKCNCAHVLGWQESNFGF